MAKKEVAEVKEVKEKKVRRNLEAEILEDLKNHEQLENNPRAIRDRMELGHSTVLRYLELLARTGQVKKTQISNTAFYTVE
jgi:Fe2+ or Zn2+ uptake regulation protein